MEAVETPVDQKVQEEQISQTFLESLSDFRCPQCTFRAGTLKYLQKHEAQKHPKIEYRCTGCKEVFLTKNDLNTHHKSCDKYARFAEGAPGPSPRAQQRALIIRKEIEELVASARRRASKCSCDHRIVR